MRLRRLLPTAVALAAVLVAMPAMAADAPVKTPAFKAPPKGIVVAPWTGGFLGLHGGYAWSDTHATTASSGIVSYDGDGWIGGVQVGYDHQFGAFVFGFEADATWADLDSRRFFSGGGGNTVRRSLDYFGTVRARAGYAIHNVLLYATGGFAWGHGSSTSTVSGKASADHTGTAYGLGIDWMYAPRMVVGLEWVRIDLGRSNYVYSDGSVRRADIDADTLRARWNYKF